MGASDNAILLLTGICSDRFTPLNLDLERKMLAVEAKNRAARDSSSSKGGVGKGQGVDFSFHYDLKGAYAIKALAAATGNVDPFPYLPDLQPTREKYGFGLPATAILPEDMTEADPEDLAQLVEEGWSLADWGDEPGPPLLDVPTGIPVASSSAQASAPSSISGQAAAGAAASVPSAAAAAARSAAVAASVPSAAAAAAAAARSAAVAASVPSAAAAAAARSAAAVAQSAAVAAGAAAGAVTGATRSTPASAAAAGVNAAATPAAADPGEAAPSVLASPSVGGRPKRSASQGLALVLESVSPKRRRACSGVAGMATGGAGGGGVDMVDAAEVFTRPAGSEPHNGQQQLDRQQGAEQSQQEDARQHVQQQTAQGQQQQQQSGQVQEEQRKPVRKHRWKPKFVQKRIASSRELHYKDFIAPVGTADEKALFGELHDAHYQKSPRIDWVTVTREWNQRAYNNLVQKLGKAITFKQESHLRAYNKSLSKDARLMHVHAAIDSQESSALHVQQQQNEGADVSISDAHLAAALCRVVHDCIAWQEQQQEPQEASQLQDPDSQSEVPSLPSSHPLMQLVNAFQRLNQQAAGTAAAAGAGSSKQAGGGWLSRSTKQFTVVGGGVGKGGAGGGKTCVPCTMVRLNLTSEDEARKHTQAVINNGPHQKKGGCPYCKCYDAKKKWKEGIFELKRDCAKCRSK